MRRGKLIAAVVMALVAVFGYFGYREINPITGEKQHITLTQEQEIALGLQAAPEMAEQFGGLYPDAEIQRDVESIGNRLVQQSVAGSSAYRFSFHVLKDPQTINAFALPGGPIFVTWALLQKLENEAQLAGVLGHEIGHVVARHAAEHMAKSKLAQGLLGAVGTATYEEGASGRGQMAAAAAAFVAQMVSLKYGREDELESDRLGVRLMSEAKYDPHGMLEVMRILAENSNGDSGQSEFFSSHPNYGNREETINAAIAERYPNGIPAELTMGRRMSQ